MAREVLVCNECGKETVEGICPDHGPCQTMSLDDYARLQDGTTERELTQKIKDSFPEMTGKEVAKEVKNLI